MEKIKPAVRKMANDLEVSMSSIVEDAIIEKLTSNGVEMGE